MCQVEKQAPDIQESSRAPVTGGYDPRTRHVFGEYVVHCRPGLRHFLEGLCSMFEVVVWTRLPKRVARVVTRFFFKDFAGPHAEVLALEDCITLECTDALLLCTCSDTPEDHRGLRTRSSYKMKHDECMVHPQRGHPRPIFCHRKWVEFPDHPEGLLRLKVLHKAIWESGNFRMKDFSANASNTLLIDSSPESSILNPVHNVLFPFAYKGEVQDLTLDSLKEYLIGLEKSRRSVAQYMTQCPAYWGQRPPSWRSSPISLKVQASAIKVDRTLVLNDLDFVGSYSKLNRHLHH